MDFHPVFLELHSQLDQEGPGSNESTKKAFHLLPSPPDNYSVLDVGCGPGRQTLFLAQHLKGTITAVDIHQPYLNHLEQKLESTTKHSDVRTICKSMNEMEFKEDQFDLIWSEGALYVMGVENALSSFKKILKTPGYLAFSELCLFTQEPNSDVKSFWKEVYPGIKSIDENLAVIKQAGYEVIGHFNLPPSDWEEYYGPLLKRIQLLEEKYADDTTALQVLKDDQNEIEFYSKHSKDYGYTFFVLSRH